MIYFLIALIGILLGYLIAKFTKEELKSGLIYFKLLEIILLLILIIGSLYFSFNIYLFIIGIIVGVFIRFEYLYFGILLVSSLFNKELLFLNSSLVFVYGLPCGSIIYLKKNLRYLFYSSLLFLLSFIVYFFDYNLISFASGGLISILSFKVFRVIINKR